ncbi:MAG: TraR/DksA C4-type zinc finger protein [Verrucomicrobiae bacterium]|nr:TraR/DksA C4-type zinc finger protein [Verrucomicrobiae bacterium]
MAKNSKAPSSGKKAPSPIKAEKKAPSKAEVKTGKAAPTAKVALPAPAPTKLSKPAAEAKVAKPAAAPVSPAKLSAFTKQMHHVLLDLRDSLLSQMQGIAKDTLRSRAEGSEASAFGMHQADAGSDAYDRDFALNLLSQEQDALHEINEALRRVEDGTYGICEISGNRIPEARLRAIPFARLTVQCQEELEKQQMSGHYRPPVTSLFGLSGDEKGDDFDDEDKD